MDSERDSTIKLADLIWDAFSAHEKEVFLGSTYGSFLCGFNKGMKLALYIKECNGDIQLAYKKFKEREVK